MVELLPTFKIAPAPHGEDTADDSADGNQEVGKGHILEKRSTPKVR